MDQNILLELVPEVDDILDFQVTNQLVLIKPLVVEVVTTKGGIILSGTGPGGQGTTVDIDKTRVNMPQKAVVVSCGSKVYEIKAGMTVFYYNSDLRDIMIRCGEDLYYGIQEYAIKAFIKQ